MTREKIYTAYEQIAKSYNDMIDHKPHNAYYDRPSTLGLIPEIKGKSILDAACGPGKYAEILIANGAMLTGFDISPTMVEFARERNKNSGTFFVHDLTKPLEMLKNDTFDTVLCALAMHYIQNWTITIREFFRLLKPGGFLVISIEHPFFEYNYFKSDRYFDVEAVQCTWNGFGTPVEMHSYRRPLQECLEPLTSNGFYIDKLIEPRPVEEFEKYDPKHFRELNAFPAFMGIRAIKKQSTS